MRSAAEARRLLHLGVPPRREEWKERLRAGIPIGGAQIAECALAEAFLRYRPLEDICFVSTSAEPIEQVREQLSEYPDSDGSTVVSAEEVALLPGRSVIFQNSPRLYEAAGLRSLWGARDWPIVGITHSLSVSDGAAAAMFTALPSGYLMPFDRLVCTSDAGEQAYQEMQRQALKSFGIENCAGRGYAQIQTDVIPLGIDVEQFVPGPVVRPERSRLGVCDDEILFLYCGRFSVEFKMDPFPLLAVFAAAFRGQSRVKLVLAGDTAGAGHVRIPEIAHRLGIASQISIISDPSATVKLGLYQAADIFVSFSDNLQETFGLTILEAMSCGLPVVATDWSGYRETVVSGETGFLVPTTWCSPDSYSSKTSPFFPEAATHLLFSQEVSFDMRVAVACMQRLADDPQLRRALGERGRLRAERHYAWQTIAAAYGKLFHSLFDEATVSGTAGQPDAAGYPPFSYDHPAVFGHFATHVQNMPALVQRLADDIAFQAAVEMIAPTAAEMLSAAFRSHEVLPSARLLRELTSVLGQPRAAVRVVQLLLKYGVIAAI